MPKLASYLLAWSFLHQAYKLYEGQRNEALDIIPESPAWLVGVSQVSSFAFHGQHGSYTARKERKQRSEGYWYAYARGEEKLTKRCLGKGADLTLARLEQAAQELRRCPRATLQQHATTTPPASAPRSGHRLADRRTSICSDEMLCWNCGQPISGSRERKPPRTS